MREQITKKTASYPVNKAKQFRNISPLDMGAFIPTTPSPVETECDRDTAADLAVASWVDEVPTLALPAADVYQLTRQESAQVVLMSSSWHTPSIDGISIYNQSTWLLPALPGSAKNNRQGSLSEKQAPGGESYVELIRGLVKNSGIYAISSLAGPLVSLLLAPFLTRTLTHTDYGALVVLNTVVTLVAGVTALGLSPAFNRFYSYEAKARREQLDGLSSYVLFSLLILTPLAIVGVVAAPWLSEVVLGSTIYSGAIRVAAVLVLTQNMTNPGLIWLRVENRAALFSVLSVGNLLITAGANVLLVGILHMGVAGAQVANGLGDVLIIACTLPIIFWRAGLHLRLAIIASMVAFGVPNVINLISGWVLQLSDRYLLERFASLSLAAGYSVAYTIGGILATAIISPFTFAWFVLIYQVAKRKDAQHIFKLIFRWFSFMLLFATLGLSLFGSSILDFLFTSSYHAQSSIIPIIALSTVFLGIFNVVSLGTSLKRKTWLISLCFIVSSLINIGLNIILIPLYGTMGAGLATLVAYLTLALITYLFNQRIYPVDFEIGLFLFSMGIGIAVYLMDSVLSRGQSTMITWSVHGSGLLLYGLGLFLIGWLLPIREDIIPSHNQNIQLKD